MSIRSLVIAVSAAALLAVPAASFATTQSSTLTVTGTVTNNCTGFITGTFAGGQAPNFDPTSNTAASNSVDENIKCTAGAQPTLTISNGNQGTTGNNDRKYTGANHGFLLAYMITDNSATAGGAPYLGNTPLALGTSQGPATPIDINVTQTIPATAQNNMAPADSYSDTITLTLNF